MSRVFQLASEGIKRDYTQSLVDKASYTFEEKDGDELVRQVKASLGDYFSSKRKAAQVSVRVCVRCACVCGECGHVGPKREGIKQISNPRQCVCTRLCA